MARLVAILVLSFIAAASAGGAEGKPLRVRIPAGPHGPVPVTQDLDRMARIDARLASVGIFPRDSRFRPARCCSYAESDPSHVVGWSGPPGTYGDSVLNSGPLPPGSIGNLDGYFY